MLEGKHPCQGRLAFEELLAHYMSLRNLRALAQNEAAIALRNGDAQIEKFRSALPFALTAAQQRVVAELLSQGHWLRRAGCDHGTDGITG